MVNITFGQYQEGSVDGYNNVCKVLFFLWLADTSLSFVCSFVSLKIQTMFEMNDLVSEIYELSAVQFKMLTGGIANFGITLPF